MSVDEPQRMLARLRALMAMTVANGCTAEEELAAARMVGRLIGQLDGPPTAAPPPPKASWAAAERESPQYQASLAKVTLEGLLKSALQELAINHINTVSPPKRNLRGQPVEWVRTIELLEPYLNMMLQTSSRLGRDIVAQSIEELILDGMLPDALAIPRE